MRVTFLPRFRGNPYQGDLEDGLAELGVQIVRLPQRLISLVAGLLWSRPDIIHLHWLHPFTMGGWTVTAFCRYCVFRLAWATLRVFGRKIVWTVHNLKDHEGRNSGLERACTRYVSRRADAILVHCTHAKAQLLEMFPRVRPGLVHVIPHGNYCKAYENTLSRSEARKRLGLPAGEFVFLFFGQIRPYKGVLELIDAFRTVPHREVRLVIAGLVCEAGAEVVLAEHAARDSRVDYRPGFVLDGDVQAYLNACDVLVCPYRDILTSGSVMLGASFARPCIAPRLGCIPEQIEEADSFLYDVDQAGGLAAALLRAITARDRLAGMGERSRIQVSQWSWRRVAQMTHAVYRVCLGRYSISDPT
jgi:glycosyltransferase involved in cell wall biosynthesis